jgi:alpha-mannosidase
VWHEEVGAVLKANLLDSGGHYSPVMSRLDWLSLNHFAAMSDSTGAGVTLSNADCAFMKLGASSIAKGVSTLDAVTPQISVLAGGQVDGGKLGIPRQGGDAYFLQRFALTTHRQFDAARSMRFALEHQNPLRAGVVTGREGYPEKSFSLVTASDPNVLLWALKPADDGPSHGIVARLWNVSAEPREISLSLEHPAARAARVTHIETDVGEAVLREGVLRTPIRPWQLLTFRVY